MVHAAIANAFAMVGESDRKKKDKDKEECQLLVPSSQSANIIGKSGSTIKKLRKKTRTNIRVTPKDASDPAHSCALEFDNFVLISGESEAVKKALFAISAIMYKFAPKARKTSRHFHLRSTAKLHHPVRRSHISCHWALSKCRSY